MEYLDVLDEKGDKTGELKPRSEIHRDGNWHRAVHIWLLNSKRELLIQRRAKTVNVYPNCWDISSAGHISAGENSLDSAIKEAEEEIGIVLTREQLKLIGVVTQEGVLKNNTYFDNEFDDIYLVKINLKLSDIFLKDGEVSEVQWIPWQELQIWVKEARQDLVPHLEEYKLLFKTLEKL